MERVQAAVASLYQKYSNNAEIIDKLVVYTEQKLPEFLAACAQRQQRKEILEQESELFIHSFMNDPMRQYFYIPISDIYVQYNGEHYTTINENDILHTILSGISSNKTLIAWKYKIKTTIMKRIKERNMLFSIPESHTIQFVLDRLTPVLLDKKDKAKYFLSVIGDNVFKKNTGLIHLLSPQCKDFVTLLLEKVQCYYRNTHRIDTTFKYKYYDYDYHKCRIINFSSSVHVPDYWESFTKSHILDIVAVAAHYSHRYESADGYIRSHDVNDEVRKEVLQLDIVGNSSAAVDGFVSAYLQESNGLSVHWTDMYYLWNHYLSAKKLPNLLFIKSLKAHLQKKLGYDAGKDIYTNVSSLYLRGIKTVKEFWEDNMAVADDEFEVSELCSLYAKHMAEQGSANVRVAAPEMLSVIKHFYRVHIVDQKHVRGVSCALWNKKDEMLAALEHLRLSHTEDGEIEDLSFYEAYQKYRDACSEIGLSRIVSKSYFGKYIDQVVPSQYINNGKLSYLYWSI